VHVVDYWKLNIFIKSPQMKYMFRFNCRFWRFYVGVFKNSVNWTKLWFKLHWTIF
jgi:hypothetical protein